MEPPPHFLPGYHAWPGGPPIGAIYQQIAEEDRHFQEQRIEAEARAWASQSAVDEADATARRCLLLLFA